MHPIRDERRPARHDEQHVLAVSHVQLHRAGHPALRGWDDHNDFFNITAHTMNNSIVLFGFAGSIHDNTFRLIEIGANVYVSENCSENRFDQIVSLQNPVMNGNHDASGLTTSPPDSRNRQPFQDETGFNTYTNLWVLTPVGLQRAAVYKTPPT